MILAANAVLWNLVLIGGFFLDGFATAAETLCGQSVGARDAASPHRRLAQPALVPRLRLAVSLLALTAAAPSSTS